MLESEAREKWCDRAIIIGKINKVSYNRVRSLDDIPEGTQCIASKCMRWIPCETWRSKVGKVMDEGESGEMLKVSDGDCAYNLQAYEKG